MRRATLLLWLSACGGVPFSSASEPADAGRADSPAVDAVSADSGAEFDALSSLPDGLAPLEPLDARAFAMVADATDATYPASDAGGPERDGAAGALDASHGAPGDAGVLCCRIVCGSGLFRDGFTCQGACAVGATCTWETVCGEVVTC